jgi:hypothetical protein
MIPLALGTSSAGGTGPPSVEAVRARLRQQQEKIESLHLRVRGVTSLSADRKLLEERWAGPPLPRHLGTDEVILAFKGEKRYFRVLELEYSPPPFAGPAIKQPRPNSQYLDEARAWTGKVLLERNRDPEGGKETTFGFRYRSLPAEDARDCFPPSPYLMSVGLAVPDPTGKDPAGRNLQQMCCLPEALTRWPYELAEKTQSIDGAECVVLRAEIRCELPVGRGSAQKRVDDKLWLDLKHGLALRKRETRIDGQLVRIINRDFVELLSGFWLPKQSRTETFAPPGVVIQAADRPAMTRELKLCFWLVNQAVDDTFDVALTPYCDKGNGLDLVPAFHKRSLPSADADSRRSEEWAVRGVGRRFESYRESILTVEVDTPRWHFIWTPQRNVVTAWPSRLGQPSVAVMSRRQVVQEQDWSTAMIARRIEILNGRDVDRLTFHYPRGVGEYGWPTPAHGWNPKGPLSVSGTDFLTRTWWFDPKTDLCVGRRCGCIHSAAEAKRKLENPPPDFTIDYPPPEGIPRELLKFEIPRKVRLGISDPELGREIFSEGEVEPGVRQ